MAEAINSLKSKITNLREELEKSQDKYEAKCKEVEEEKKKRNEVMDFFFSTCILASGFFAGCIRSV